MFLCSIKIIGVDIYCQTQATNPIEEWEDTIIDYLEAIEPSELGQIDV